MKHVFSWEGRQHLARLLRSPTLLAFDFDGTLAPIVARPDDARIAPAVSRRLEVLSARMPVAVISGRSLSDVRSRLGFAPRFVVGNHGAEREIDGTVTVAWQQTLDDARHLIEAHMDVLTEAGIQVEDKGQSLALHYRQAPDRHRAAAVAAKLFEHLDPSLRVFGGKQVFNVVAAQAPDKFEAIRVLMAETGAESAFFAGDDLNDEPVFAAAPEHWFTLKVGAEGHDSKAQYLIDAPSGMPLLLDSILALLPDAP